MTEVSSIVVSRVAFSYESLMHATEWLVWKQGDDSAALGIWNAHVDSFLVHARRLHDFLLGQGNHHDDLHLSDLVDDIPDIAVPQTTKLRDQMNRRVLHLTNTPDPILVDWPVVAIAKELGRAMNSVIEVMRASGSEHYERFRHAREGEPAFRKLVS